MTATSCCFSVVTRSTIGGGGAGSNFVPALGGDDTKRSPTGDIFGQPPGEMSSVRGKLANHVGDHVVLSPEGAVLVTSTGTESSYPRPPQSLNNSCLLVMVVLLLLAAGHRHRNLPLPVVFA